SVQTEAEGLCVFVRDPARDLVRRQVLGHPLVILVVRVGEFLVGISRNVRFGVVEVFEEELQSLRLWFVLKFERAQKVLARVALSLHGQQPIRINLALEHVTEDHELVLVLVDWYGPRQSQHFLVAYVFAFLESFVQDVVPLDDLLDYELRRSLRRKIFYTSGFVNRAEDDERR